MCNSRVCACPIITTLYISLVDLYRTLAQYLNGRKQLAITSFTTAINKCLKDGSNGTRDYRALAGLTMLAGILGLVPDYFLHQEQEKKLVFQGFVLRS